MPSYLLCGLPRRLVIAIYDGIVVVALLLLATVPPTIAMVTLSDTAQEQSLVFRLGMTLYLLLVAFAFYGGFWTHGGQTLGMRAWRVRVVREDGGRLTWRDAAIRYAAAILSWLVVGAGFWWSLFDRDGRTWHDRLSGTELRRMQ
jgi:uncharacterized RDD family membrane protein YckC